MAALARHYASVYGTYVPVVAGGYAVSISLTELRQRLFELADQVAESGLPLEIERRGVRLRLIRVDAPETRGGRLARLRSQPLVIGAPLQPSESPAQWSALPLPNAAEAPAPYRGSDPSAGE